MPISKQPAFLKTGDKVALLAPAKTAAPEAVRSAMETIRTWGLVVQEAPHLFRPWHQFGATDDQRRQDLQGALDAADIRAIICVRGGYGSSRIVDGLKWEAFAQNPKWLVGFSDITVLHHALIRQGYQSIHATMPLLFDEPGAKPAVEKLRAVLFGESQDMEVAQQPLNRFGKVTGPLIGGNLSMICHQIGSATEVDMQDALLFIEEVGEYYYSMDRMLVQLDRAGKLAQLKSIIAGSFTEMKDQEKPFGESPEEIISRFAAKYDLPLALGFPFGHQALNLPVIQGAVATLEVTTEGTSLRYQ